MASVRLRAWQRSENARFPNRVGITAPGRQCADRSRSDARTARLRAKASANTGMAVDETLADGAGLLDGFQGGLPAAQISEAELCGVGRRRATLCTLLWPLYRPERGAMLG